MDSLKLTYKIYLEAEDISCSRIASTTSYFKNLFQNCTNSYLQKAQVDDECDMDDFTLRLYVEETIVEEICQNTEDAKSFLGDTGSKRRGSGRSDLLHGSSESSGKRADAQRR